MHRVIWNNGTQMASSGVPPRHITDKLCNGARTSNIPTKGNEKRGALCGAMVWHPCLHRKNMEPTHKDLLEQVQMGHVFLFISYFWPPQPLIFSSRYHSQGGQETTSDIFPLVERPQYIHCPQISTRSYVIWVNLRFILHHIIASDPDLGPVYISKVDLADA